jgi:hypothetical protein
VDAGADAGVALAGSTRTSLGGEARGSGGADDPRLRPGRCRLGTGHRRHTAVVPIGESVTFTVEIANEGSSTEQLLVDLRVCFVKANGRPSPKVVKLKALDPDPQASVRLTKMISLAQQTTRTNYPGLHRGEVLVNGGTSGSRAFDVVEIPGS